MISVFTFTLGRPIYLVRQLRSLLEAARAFDGEIEHHICYQGVDPDPEVAALTAESELANLEFHIHRWPENLGIAGGVNFIVPQLRGDLLMKMDDDCSLESRSFFSHVMAISTLKPNAVFSPFPVGLIGWHGGAPAISREVAYSQATETFYTLRKVKHIGGLCRVAPASLVRDWKLDENRSMSGTEDQQHSARCLSSGIEMYYLENALIVEHQETDSGQRARNAGYFEKKGQGRATYTRESLFQRGVTSLERRCLRAFGQMRMWAK